MRGAVQAGCRVECRVGGAAQAGCRVECRVGGRAKGRVRGGVLRRVGGGVEDDAVRAGVGWEEAKMACEITSDAILPI